MSHLFYLYLQGIDTSKVLLKTPENVKLPVDKEKNAIKVKIIKATQREQEEIFEINL